MTCYIRVFFKFQNPYVEICNHSDATVILPLREHSCESFRRTMKTRDVGEPMKCFKIVIRGRHFVVQPQSELKSEVLIPYRYDYCWNYLVSLGSASIRIYQIRLQAYCIDNLSTDSHCSCSAFYEKQEQQLEIQKFVNWEWQQSLKFYFQGKKYVCFCNEMFSLRMQDGVISKSAWMNARAWQKTS